MPLGRGFGGGRGFPEWPQNLNWLDDPSTALEQLLQRLRLSDPRFGPIEARHLIQDPSTMFSARRFPTVAGPGEASGVNVGGGTPLIPSTVGPPPTGPGGSQVIANMLAQRRRQGDTGREGGFGGGDREPGANISGLDRGGFGDRG